MQEKRTILQLSAAWKAELASRDLMLRGEFHFGSRDHCSPSHQGASMRKTKIDSVRQEFPHLRLSNTIYIVFIKMLRGAGVYCQAIPAG
jgi:hypothetical protein